MDVTEKILYTCIVFKNPRAMKTTTLTLSLLFATSLFLNAQELYEDAMTAASYAYSHSKKAYGANNVFHTQEYADKAAEAFEKVELLAEKCGCGVANETAYQAKTNMISALDQDTYERSRYYTKQAKELGSQILEQLTDCQSGIETAEEGIIASNDNDAIEMAAQEMDQRQKALEEQQRQLALQQQQLAQQIAEQQQAKAAFEAKRAAELKEQTIVKTKAEQALQKLEIALKELSIAFENEAIQLEKDYVRTENELANESLKDTKSFYVDRAKELTKSALKQFAIYADD